VQNRSAKEEISRGGIELLSPIATAILEEANVLFLSTSMSSLCEVKEGTG
jgi:hypothetical protein